MQRTDILRLVGNTPLVEIRRLNPYPNVKIMAKLESMNPGGSIKDRVAVAMIEAAEARGELTPGKTIIEATSGNTGVGLAMVAAVKGYKMLLLMPDSASEERKRIMRGYGAEIRLTPGRMGTDGAIEEAYRLARTEPDTYVLMDQFNNPSSIDAHYNGTGLEIWEQTAGAVTHAVATLGTSGTAMGLAKRLHEHPGVKVVAVEPFAGHKIQGLKNMHESYPPGIYNKKVLDQILHVEDEEAFSTCRSLAREEGLFVGMSSGAAMAGALQLAASLQSDGQAEGKPSLIVVIFPDNGERYLSTPLFAPKALEGLRLMNLATGHKTVIDASGSLNIYTIGPSLDEPDDPDAWRRLVLSDVLARHLARSGAQVKVAVGLADLDDRTLSAARAANQSRADYVAGIMERIKKRAETLRLLPETIFEPASASVPQALDICRKLLGKGQAYEKLRSVYFDVRRDKRYGNMHLMDMDKLSVGKTVDLDDYVKDNPLDFTLLKRASLQDLKLGDVIETEWGNVRPSWFVQIAVAGLAALGRVDVLVAGEDHQFPHLENLRVVWSAAGVEPRAWLADRKLAREEGVALELGQLMTQAGGQNGSAGGLRLWLLSAAYRKPLSASGMSLSMWARNWHKVQETACGLRLAQGNAKAKGKDVPEDVAQAVFDLKAGLAAALEDDLSLHRYWPKLFTFVKLVNGWLSSGAMSGAAASLCLQQLEAADAVLGILDLSQMPVACDCLPEAVRALVDAREGARKSKDFTASDALREKLAACGYRVEDTVQGPRVYSL
jgi:cystathionine beta-synthase